MRMLFARMIFLGEIGLWACGAQSDQPKRRRDGGAALAR